jgi:hypothetical protein
VTAVYVDSSALLLPSAQPGTPDEALAPGAADAVQLLVEAGFDVVVLAADEAVVPPLAAPIRRTDTLPENLDAGTWYLTAEPHPVFGRPRGGMTMLVGPRRPDGKVPLPRFDLTARDIASAAMEILTRDAMA